MKILKDTPDEGMESLFDNSKKLSNLLRNYAKNAGKSVLPESLLPQTLEKLDFGVYKVRVVDADVGTVRSYLTNF